MMIYMKKFAQFYFVLLGTVAPIIATGATRMDDMSELFFPSVVANSPKIDTEVTAEVGESITSAFSRVVKPAIELLESIDENVELTFGVKKITIPPGRYPYRGENAFGTYFDATTGLIFIPKNSKVQLMVCYAPRSILCEFVAKLKVGENIKMTETISYPNIGFRKELIYTGGGKKEITFSYREFVNDYARPAFSQELKYDISDDKIIGFKGARFEVINSNNTEIKYKVLKHFN